MKITLKLIVLILFSSCQNNHFSFFQIENSSNQIYTFTINQEKYNQVALQNKEEITLEILFDNKIQNAILTKKHHFTDSFKVIGSSNKELTDIDLGVHFFGVLENHENSFISISFFKDEMLGMLQTDKNTNAYSLHKTTNKLTGEHTYFWDNTNNQDALICDTEDQKIEYTNKMLSETNTDYSRRFSVNFEIDHDVYNSFNSIQSTATFAIGLISQSIFLYHNAGLEMKISGLKIWDTSSPYAGSTNNEVLNSFLTHTGAYPGDLSHLLTLKGSGGKAAGFNGMCAANTKEWDRGKCFSSIYLNHLNIPQYSWSVSVVTHEMGHLLGSRHTHACAWNGNNTAIDNCGSFWQQTNNRPVEGKACLNITNPTIPSSGGTIMSYCHLNNVGINFNNGFGNQPKNLIINKLANDRTKCGPRAPLSELDIRNSINNKINGSQGHNLNLITVPKYTENNIKTLKTTQYSIATSFNLEKIYTYGESGYLQSQESIIANTSKSLLRLVINEDINKPEMVLMSSGKRARTTAYNYTTPGDSKTTIDYTGEVGVKINLEVASLDLGNKRRVIVKRPQHSQKTEYDIDSTFTNNKISRIAYFKDQQPVGVTTFTYTGNTVAEYNELSQIQFIRTYSSSNRLIQIEKAKVVNGNRQIIDRVNISYNGNIATLIAYTYSSTSNSLFLNYNIKVKDFKASDFMTFANSRSPIFYPPTPEKVKYISLFDYREGKNTIEKTYNYRYNSKGDIEHIAEYQMDLNNGFTYKKPTFTMYFDYTYY